MPPRLLRHPPSWYTLLTTSSNTSYLRFSTASSLSRQTKLRHDFFEWLDGPGAVFKQPQPSRSTNYLSAYDVMTGEPKENQRWINYPFPLNQAFPSSPVVSDELANEVYYRIVEGGKSVRMVSAELNVSLQRVAAIVRLKTIEERWIKEVRSSYSIPTQVPFSQYDPSKDLHDEPTKNRLVLKTPKWLNKNTVFFLREIH